MAEQMAEQTVNRRSDGTFAQGNSIGRRFEPGESGNPQGRPRPCPISEAIAGLLDQNDGEAVAALAQVSLQKALGGDFRFYREIMERMEGKVTHRAEITAGLSTRQQLPEDYLEYLDWKATEKGMLP